MVLLVLCVLLRFSLFSQRHPYFIGTPGGFFGAKFFREFIGPWHLHVSEISELIALSASAGSGGHVINMKAFSAQCQR